MMQAFVPLLSESFPQSSNKQGIWLLSGPRIASSRRTSLNWHSAVAVVVSVAQLPRLRRHHHYRVAKLAQSHRRRIARPVKKFQVDLPVPSPPELSAEVSKVTVTAQESARTSSTQLSEAAAKTVASSEQLWKSLSSSLPSLPQLPQPSLPPELLALVKKVPVMLPATPIEVQEALRSLKQALATTLPADVMVVIDKPGVLEPVALPAGLGLVVVGLLALRRGRQQWKEELPRRYNYAWIEGYWQARPLQLFSRFAEAGAKIGYYSLCVKVDEWTGNEDTMRPQRAVQARELITDLGVTFIKTAQLWASRPDILPEEYIKEYQKLLEQVRPFGKDLAMETLRKSESNGKKALDLFKDMSAFDEPIAAASVGQVYKATLGDRTVAVKVQRPDVREQSTLDLYVIRSSCMLGAKLPFERLARQCKQTIDLIDLTGPTFIEELDYESEANNQRRFAESVNGCDLITGAVVVPEVLYSSQAVLVQEWLDGKKLNEFKDNTDQANKVVKLLLNSYMVQFLETGYLHGDPHPGNFILMDTGKLGILDYGLMTNIDSQKRLSFIEFIMHIQAKEYAACLQDLVNLEFFPAALAKDEEARDVIVPALANTLATLYEDGGDLKKKAEQFKKQREEMKASGKLDALREQLQAIAKKYAGAFKLPPYFTLILRAFALLEGLGLKTNENFAIVKECFPYIARRLLTDDSFRMREALRSYLYKGRRRIAVSRIDDIVNGFGSFTNLMKGSRASAMRAGGPTISEPEEEVVVTSTKPSDGSAEAQTERPANPGVIDSATLDIAEVVFSPDGNYLQDLLIDEGVAAIDALSRAALVRLVQRLGPLALPITLPLSFVLGTTDSSQVLQREDKEALLVIRRIVQLIQRPNSTSSKPATEREEELQESVDLSNVVVELQRLQPLASGLFPAITPGAAAFARRFGQQLVRRILLRSAEDIERGVGLGGQARLLSEAT